MKVLLFALLAVALTGAPAAAADAFAGATEISVSGTGSVALAPDVATVNATVETYSPNASDAVSKNNVVYNRIVAALEKLGIARDDIALAYYNVSYQPKPGGVQPEIAPAPAPRYGYTVSREFNVRVRDIGKAGNVTDACASAGATSIGGVSFGLADPSAARASATAKAVDDARANAELLAQAAHLRIVSIKSIDLGGGEVGPRPMLRMAAANVAPPTQFDSSNVNVSVSVNVTFLASP